VEPGNIQPVQTHVTNNKLGLGSGSEPKVEDDVETKPQAKGELMMCIFY